MSPHEPVHAFIDNYVKLLPESDLTEFQKVLEMKVVQCYFSKQSEVVVYSLKFSYRTCAAVVQDVPIKSL